MSKVIYWLVNQYRELLQEAVEEQIYGKGWSNTKYSMSKYLQAREHYVVVSHKTVSM